jgi:hypothetical protein
LFCRWLFILNVFKCLNVCCCCYLIFMVAISY